MSAIFSSLAPVFILIMLGYILRNAFRLKQTFWEKLEWLVYFLLFPSLIVHHLSQFSLIGAELGSFSLALLLSTFVVSGLLLLAKRFMNIGGPAFTSVFMGSTRFNTYIGIAAAGSLYGETGLIIASVAIAVLVPQVNILSIFVLTKFVIIIFCSLSLNEASSSLIASIFPSIYLPAEIPLYVNVSIID